MSSSVKASCQNFKHLTTDFRSIPKELNPIIQDFAKPHVESFDFLITEGLNYAVQDLQPVEFALPSGQRVMLAIKDAQLGRPSLSNAIFAKDSRIFPSECRLKGSTYRAKLMVQFSWSVNGAAPSTEELMLGELPIMVKSKCCYLSKMSPKELVECHEEAEEFGGYFIVNGLEKIVRMLIAQRRNYPLVMQRPSWKKRGKLFSEYGVSIRCVRRDQSGCNMTLHYLTNGTVKVMFMYRKEMFFLPVALLLKALCNFTDREIYRELISGKEEDSHYKSCIVMMLRQLQSECLYNQTDVLSYIGARFRPMVYCPEWHTDRQIAEFVLRQCVCVHLETNRDKFNLLVYMTKKLYAGVNHECLLESPDNPMNHEVLLGGHLYLMVLKERLEYWLTTVRWAIEKKAKDLTTMFQLTRETLSHAWKAATDLTRSMEYLIATGNVVTKYGLALQQTSGMSVVAEKLNYMRFVSHFRCVHRGSFFAEMRTTTARKLLPESWGFICPVHTPDGTPCGLLNHLTATCQVVVNTSDSSNLPKVLVSLGMDPLDLPTNSKDSYCVHLDGRVIGYVTKCSAQAFVDQLRYLKVTDNSKVPKFTEICLVPSTGKASQYAGIFLFTSPARMMRPVLNLVAKTVEFIGTFEQVYLDISVNAKEVHKGITTHLELAENSILSALANLTPLSDFNQSPRNMYQCQMGKQTMGTPCHSFKYRTDSKMYRVLTPQSPLFRTIAYDNYGFDNYPLGTNAIVAVISYTGYDMEDAMILNKSSFERGFAHGFIYKNEFVDLMKKNNKNATHYFGCKNAGDGSERKLNPDGFPPVGTLLKDGDPLYSCINITTGEAHVHKYKSHEEAYLEAVVFIGSDKGTSDLQKACIRLRIPRNPIIGDKFASRAGQKGICSQKWPQADMPFTESGMTPDIIFNPHGFPSRMTIGMMIESMAGKSGCLHGRVHDASPFKFSEDDPAIDYFGRLLEEAGYNYYGTERMYSGVDGRELNADIFFGVVYYQRLRHMVADKFQVRTTGPVDVLTHQPVKGRKRAGGIRFGEMERDSLLAHGISYLLQDRLFNCSDRSLDYVCVKCGSLLSPILSLPKTASTSNAGRRWTCSVCDRSDFIELIALPYVFRFLAAELASVNIKVILSIK